MSDGESSGRKKSAGLRMGPPLPVQCTPDQRQMRGHRRVRNPPGYYGNVTLDGVRFVRVYSWPASIPEGNGTRLTNIDDRASADQRAALLALDGAKEGGLYFEIFASVCRNVLEPVFARLEIETDREHRRAKVIIPDVWNPRGTDSQSCHGRGTPRPDRSSQRV